MKDSRPLKGLLLVGGRSSRMGSDKASLVYQDGLSAQERGLALLSGCCEEAYLSQRTGEGEKVILDAYGEIGPLGAIASAFDDDPEAAWLVMACDLPLVSEEVLQTLVRGRLEESGATAFRGNFKGWPEPLCAIYEPSMRSLIQEAIKKEDYCPRHLLEGQAHLLSLPFPSALDNANTPEERERIQTLLQEKQLQDSTEQRSYHLAFFAKLKEEVGEQEITIQSSARTPAQVFDFLRAQYPISLRPEMVQVAVNDVFATWSTVLQPEDRIVFMPPMSGG